MDIWLLAVLVAWLPVATALALLVGRTVMNAERRERQQRLLHRPRPGHPAPVVTITTARRHAHRPHRPLARRQRSRDGHRIAS